MTATLQPMNGGVLVRPIEYDDRQESSLVLPKTVSGHHYCEVVSVGPGAIVQSGERVEPTLKPGDIVMMLTTRGTKLRVRGEELRFTSEQEILCKVVE